MQLKSHTMSRYIGWEAREEMQNGIHVKILQSDRGGEFLSDDFSAHLERKGTVRKLTVHDTPEHNGVAERAWGTLFGDVRAYLRGSGLPKWLWGPALQHAVWVYNRTGHSALGGKSPLEVKTGIAPDVSNLWEWGTHVYVHQPEGDKLGPHAAEARWIGFDSTLAGHFIYWPNRRVITIERSVRPSTRPMHDGEGEYDDNIGPIKEIETIAVEHSQDTSTEPDKVSKSAELLILAPTSDDQGELTELQNPLIITGKCEHKQTCRFGEQTTAAQAAEAIPVELALANATSKALDNPKTLKEALAWPDSAKWSKAMDEEIAKLTE
jgi:hypothetical protein